MAKKITKTLIDKTTEAGILWDSEVRGYGLRVSSEGKKTFFVMGRVRGRALQFTIGTYGTFTEHLARSKAQSILQDMREGVDPRDVKRQDAALSVTLSEVMESYIGRPGKLKASSAAEIKRHVERVFADWKDKPIVAITETDVRRRYGEMASRGLRGGPAPGQANLSMTTLRALVNYAARQYKRSDGSPLIQHNPVGALRDHFVQLKPRTRDIPTHRVGAVWQMLTGMRENAGPDTAGWDLVMFLLLTGARRGEAASLQWKNVNLDAGWWHIPDPKNANPIWLPLSRQAIVLLKGRFDAKAKFVFPSDSKQGHLMDARAVLERVAEIVGHRISAHDLRRTFVSVGVTACGIDLHKIELLTNHVPKGITAKHYLQTQRLQYLLPEVQKIADFIEQQAAIAAGANVIALRA
ncbi:MAG: site-specific integrase [Hyphomicrobiaceae bacterium]|nr:MAG: site-specific integrase [Hyphomicrobiaceae bacterium]